MGKHQFCFASSFILRIGDVHAHERSATSIQDNGIGTERSATSVQDNGIGTKVLPNGTPCHAALLQSLTSRVPIDVARHKDAPDGSRTIVKGTLYHEHQHQTVPLSKHSGLD